MTNAQHAPGYVPNDAYSQEDWDEVSDTPELTEAEIMKLRPASALPPEVFSALVGRGGRPKAAVRKVPVTIRLDPDIVQAFKATGAGWQSRMNEALREAVRHLPEA